MRYEKGHKAQTRERVVAAAARRFRRDGIDATGVAGVMADAGLTHGGFYAHFASKDDLVCEALADSLDRRRKVWGEIAAAARARGESGLEGIVRYYLRPEHRDGPESGCSVACLAPEVARHGGPPRDGLAAAIVGIVDVLAAEMPPGLPPDAARDRATAIFGLLAGTLQIARVLPDPAASDAALAAGRDAALALSRRPA